MEYSIEDAEISSVSSNGLITALALGDTRVVGKAVGLDATGEKVVYSQVDCISMSIDGVSNFNCMHVTLHGVKSATKLKIKI